MTPAAPEIAETVGWLIGGARHAGSPARVLEGLCLRLRAAGVGLDRAAVFIQMIHPLTLGRRFLWEEGKGLSVVDADIRFVDDPEFNRSPPLRVMRGGGRLHIRLTDPGAARDSSVVADLIAEGFTDYIVAPLPFTDDTVQAVAWATRRPGGFSAEDEAALAAVEPALARQAEIYTLRRTALTILNTYVGRVAGERVLAGSIHRGDAETIQAAIWLSDLRGFTALADALPSKTLLDFLNGYFEAQVPPIEREGGEVLKFVGDGLLAIFPYADAASAGDACRRALRSARAACERVAALPFPAGAPRPPGPPFGLALHLGTLLYGNIGGGRRLDFTAIGPAVNLAARLETLSRTLNRTVIMSAEFAAASGEALIPLGSFPLRGIAAPVAAYGVPEEGPAP